MKNGEMGIREVVYLLIGVVIIILVLIFFGFFGEIKEGLINFFSNNNLLEKFK